MEQFRKPLAVILGFTAIGVFVNFVFAPLYDDALDVEAVWFVLNWCMAFTLMAALVVTYHDKKNAGADSGDVRTFISANAWFYATGLLAVLYLSNWVNELVVGYGSTDDVRLFFWGLIDTLFPVLMTRTSMRLWRGAPPSREP